MEENRSSILDWDAFRPEDEQFKTPYGAVPQDTVVHLRVRPLHSQAFAKGEAVLRYEFDENRTEVLPMQPEGRQRSRDVFAVTLNPGSYVGLVWYSFRFYRGDGSCVASGEYQLTVYDASETVPDWFGQGVCYQIFPDRFCRLSIPDPNGMPGGRTVHAGWDEDPIQGAVAHTPAGKDICSRDFFGGSLKGITSKLDYLRGMGVETLYFCPIFESAENHRYSTADYLKIDPMLGTEEDFRELCGEAHRRGMRVLLDGVFNHTGFVSRYFNGDGFYPEKGAYQSEDSRWADWYTFRKWPDDYECWWGIYSLPGVVETTDSYRDFIYRGADSVVRRWLRAGADGWRLDVADELPDEFIEGLHRAVRETDPNAVVIGEVWEDGSNKISYNIRRRHLSGRHLDGLMNYPFRTAALAWLRGGDAAAFRESMEELREHYPPFAFYSAMNSLGTHDTPRILTLLGVGDDRSGESMEWRRNYRMTAEQREQGLRLLKLGAELLYAFPGAPTVYYGDEAGMEGFGDPWNRRTYPWGHEDPALQAHFRSLGGLRHTHEALRRGQLVWGPCWAGVLSFCRVTEGETCAAALNASAKEETLVLPWSREKAFDLMTGEALTVKDGAVTLTLKPYDGLLLGSAGK